MPKAFILPDSAALWRIRTERGLTQDEVAIRSGYAKRTIERLEAGSRSTLVTLSDVAAVLAVPVSVLVLPAREVPAHLSEWIDSRLDPETGTQKEIELDDLISPSQAMDAVPLTCRTSKGDYTYSLRRNVTAAELCAAIRHELFSGVEGYDFLTLGKSLDASYSPHLTVKEIASDSGGTVFLIRSTSRALALATGPSFGPAQALAIARAGVPAANSLACRLYVSIFDHSFFRLPGVATLAGVLLGTVFRFALADLLYLGWLYAESNTNIQMAARIARVIKLVPVRLLNGEYFDTLAWIAYRTGDPLEGLRWARRISEDDTSERDIRAYHFYFLLRSLNADQDTQDLIRTCFESQRRESVAQARVVADDDTTSGSVDVPRRAPRLPFRTPGGLIALSIVVGFILYPRALFAVLWLLGGLVALFVLIALAIAAYDWFAKRRKALRRKALRK